MIEGILNYMWMELIPNTVRLLHYTCFDFLLTLPGGQHEAHMWALNPATKLLLYAPIYQLIIFGKIIDYIILNKMGLWDKIVYHYQTTKGIKRYFDVQM